MEVSSEMLEQSEVKEFRDKQMDTLELPALRLRLKSKEDCNDENHNVREAKEVIEDVDTDEEPYNRLEFIWKSSGQTFQNLAHMVHGTMRLQNILNALVPESYSHILETKNDDNESEDNKPDTPKKSIKVESKKQS